MAGRRRPPRWTSMTCSGRSSSAFPRSPPRSRARPSCASAGGASSPTRSSFRRFGAHHRTAPLVGYFEQRFGEKDIVFTPILEPPDRIPPRHFLSLGRAVAGAGRDIGIVELLDCRHGRVAFIDMSHWKFTLFVCDTITGRHARLAVPPEFRSLSVNGAELCAASEQGHVFGACHSCPFKVVLVSMFLTDLRPIACVYSSETGRWGNVIQHGPCGIVELPGFSTLLIGHALYCLFCFENVDEKDDDGSVTERDGILEFDLDTLSLTVMEGLPENNGIHRQIIKTGDGSVGLVTLCYPTLQMWHRKVSSHHVATWEPFKTVDLCDILGLQGHERRVRRENIMGYDEDDNEIFICLDSSLFIVQLESMQFKRHSYQMSEREGISFCHPFRSFYVAGTAIAGGCNGYEMIQDS
ncbi:hypothetical protein BS78_K169300 [Paspalum vaginatum]|uniref:Uncharacterized protein n=1 Tax=Paspalum vaginatum TaxID=158149 RepID=A0A9W8CDV8_9POAL|nr:hypothetical protein BS78_K169300 [Paspalum vaginatum]KAJ1255714.1 hypothetical protein BS78_K169300 [Paspalum vaginatum]KAJ1255715.1 hypothetical protein BS78_K169300 [Paspalum vaginatum]